MKFLTCKEMIFLLHIRKIKLFWNIERNYRNLEIGPPSFLTIIDKNDIENDLMYWNILEIWKLLLKNYKCNLIWFDFRNFSVHFDLPRFSNIFET